jgi:hypothetical protein
VGVKVQPLPDSNERWRTSEALNSQGLADVPGLVRRQSLSGNLPVWYL